MKAKIKIKNETINSLKSLNEYFDFIEEELDRNDWFSIFINSL